MNEPDSRTMRHTAPASRAVTHATAEAEALGSPRVEVAHLLIGVCRVAAATSPAELAAFATAEREEVIDLATALARQGLDPDRAAGRLREICRGLGPAAGDGPAAWSRVGSELEVWADPLVTLGTLWWAAFQPPLAAPLRQLAAELGVPPGALAFARARAPGTAGGARG